MKLLLLFVFSFLISFAQETETLQQVQSFSLEEAIKYAVENSFSTQQTRLAVTKAEKKVNETIAIGLPQINATTEYQNMLDLPVSLIPAEFFGGQPGEFAEVSFGTQHNASFGVTLSQLVFSGEYFIGLQATTIYKDISIKQHTKTEKDVRQNVSKSYYLMLISQKSLEIIDSTLKNMNVLVEETQKTFEKGFIDDLTLDQLKLTQKNIQKSKESIERMLTVSERLLKFQLGIDFDKQITLTNKLDDFVDTDYLNSLTISSFDINSNINYQIAELNVVVNQNLLKYQKSTFLPTISAFLSYSKNGMNNNFGDLFTSDWYPTTVAGLQMNIPIFSSGARRARVQQAKIDVESAEVIEKQTLQGLNTEVLQKQNDLHAAINTFNFEVENMELSKKIYDKTLVKFKQGMASNTDLTQAQNQYLGTQSNYFTALVEMLNKKAELENLLSK